MEEEERGEGEGDETDGRAAAELLLGSVLLLLLGIGMEEGLEGSLIEEDAEEDLVERLGEAMGVLLGIDTEVVEGLVERVERVESRRELLLLLDLMLLVEVLTDDEVVRTVWGQELVVCIRNRKIASHLPE